jgi:photosystem II stability/assembly factor-like uncharacterized protein
MKTQIIYLTLGLVAVFLCRFNNAQAHSYNRYVHALSTQNTCLPVQWYLTTSVTDDHRGNIYVSTYNYNHFYDFTDQLFRSTNNGVTWIELDSSIKDSSSANLNLDIQTVISAPNGDVFLYVCNTLTLRQYLLKSTDEGASWTRIALLDTTNLHGADVIVMDYNGYIYDTPTGGGLLRSTDEGNNWSVLWTNTSNSVTIDSLGNLYLNAQDNSIFRSTDNGQSWHPLSLSALPDRANILVADGSQYLYAVIDTTGIYRSSDHGDTWMKFPFQQSIWYTAITVAPNHDLYAIGYTPSYSSLDPYFNAGMIYKSTDLGATWTLSNNGLNDTLITTVAVAQNGTVFAGTVSGALFRSIDSGRSWLQLNGHHLIPDALPACEVTGLGYNNDCDQFVGTLWDGVFRSVDSGKTWQQVDNGLLDTNIFTLGVSPRGNVFALTFARGIFRSTDNGNSWQQKDSGMFSDTVQGLDSIMTSILFGNAGRIYVGTLNGVFLSTDEGDFWQELTPGVPPYEDYLNGPPILSMTFSDSGKIFAGGTSSEIFCSNDNDTSWTALPPVSYTTIYGQRYMTCLLVQGGIILAGSDSGLFRTTNAGTSWERIQTLDLDRAYINLLMHDQSGNIYARTDSGVFMSTDFGITWSSRADIDVTNGYGILSNALTCSGGTISGSLGGVDTIQKITAVNPSPNVAPSLFTLSQNYPNPAVPFTDIDYTLAQSGYVSLKIYDALGRKVATLVDGNISSGTHTAQWQPLGMPDGVYFYRLSFGKNRQIETKKLLLMK